MAQITRFMEKVVEFTKETVVGRPKQSLQRGEGGYADWVLIAILCYREREEETFRSVVDKLKVMKDIRGLLDLSLSNLPHPSTVCKALDRFSMRLFRQLLSKTLTLFELGDVTAVDASGFDRIAASRRYEKRTGYRFLAMKTTLLTDCSSGAILDIHCSMNRPHDTQIGWQVLKRNAEEIHTLTGDKGYDWDAFRAMLRERSVRPVIKHREFDSLDAAHNARLDDEIYHRRSVVESSFGILKQRYGDSLKARIWYKQFREMALKSLVKNIDSGIGASHC